MAKKRIGVFVCHCGMNIAGIVDVERVARAAMNHPNVVFAQNYIYTVSYTHLTLPTICSV